MRGCRSLDGLKCTVWVLGLVSGLRCGGYMVVVVVVGGEMGGMGSAGESCYRTCISK